MFYYKQSSDIKTCHDEYRLLHNDTFDHLFCGPITTTLSKGLNVVEERSRSTQYRALSHFIIHNYLTLRGGPLNAI